MSIPRRPVTPALRAAFAAFTLACSGATMAIEEPAFQLIEKSEQVEIRQYRPLIVAEALVEGDMGSATKSGFRLIADYIFGNNRSVRAPKGDPAEKIAMTAPVTVEPVASPEKIAMTAPVGITPQAADGVAPAAGMNATRWRVHFVMPAEYTMASLPRPVNPAVSLREVPGKRYAVLVFSGLAGADKVQEKTDELLAWLKARKLAAIATPQLARYNPPWTLPFLRRNEILVEIPAQG